MRFALFFLVGGLLLAATGAAWGQSARSATSYGKSIGNMQLRPLKKNLRYLDVAYRDATREFVKLQTTACTYHLVEIVGLMKRRDQLSASQVNTINTYLAAYNTENQKLVQAISRAGDALMCTYSAKMNEELAK